MSDKYAALRERYSEPLAPKCCVCGAEMSIQRAGGGSVVYGCDGRVEGDSYAFKEGRSFADKHYEQSRETIYNLGDPDVIELLAEREADKARIAELTSALNVANERYENRAPTEWAYNQACAAIEKHRARADNAEQLHAALEARKLVPVMYKGMELLKKEGLELIRDGLVEATVLEATCMADALLSATPAQPVAVPICPKCGDTGMADSGGVQPWGEPIEIPCDCRDAMLKQPASNSPEIPDGSAACPHCGRKAPKNRRCSIEGCKGRHVAHGFCRKHYDADSKNHDPARRESIRAADARYRVKRATAPGNDG